jgi:coenzyme F420-0:L-glutamate ligase/coenzyme F420-1:gamma-L-glutamate ligase
MSARLEIVGLAGIPEVAEGDDLAELLLAALSRSGETLREGDILVVSSKVVSKAGGLQVGATDKTGTVASQTVAVVAERTSGDGFTRVVRAKAGPVMAAAGVDASNTGGRDVLLLLPHDPDEVCRALRSALSSRTGVSALGVILSDTAGRPWRVGVVDFALGSAGVRVVDDLRGLPDADGLVLHVTTRALADEIAAAADLVKGKVERTPAALVRGLADLTAGGPDAARPEPDGAGDLVRTSDAGDWFALGSQEAVRAALGVEPGTPLAERVGIRPVGPEPIAAQVDRAVAVALAEVPPVHPERRGPDQGVDGAVDVGVDVGSTDLVVTGPDLLTVGMVGARLVAALTGEGVRHTVEVDAQTVRVRLTDATGLG